MMAAQKTTPTAMQGPRKDSEDDGDDDGADNVE